MNDLFIKRIIFERDKVSDFSKYPFSIPIINNFESLDFHSNVTFLIGENGVGKSTLIEAIALSLGLSSESGTQNFLYKSKDTHSSLNRYLTLHKSGRVPSTKYFLRAESFYNFSTEMQRLVEEDSFITLLDAYGGYLHECSHGEAFLKVVQNRFSKSGSQFIIATHSPILISYRDGEILDLNQNLKKVEYKETEIFKTYKLFLENSDRMQEYLFKNEN